MTVCQPRNVESWLVEIQLLPPNEVIGLVGEQPRALKSCALPPSPVGTNWDRYVLSYHFSRVETNSLSWGLETNS